MTITLTLARTSIRSTVFLLVLMATTAWTEPSIIEANPNTDARQLLQEAMHQDEALGNATAALDLYARVISAATSEERGVAATAQLRLGLLYERLQRDAEAQQAFIAVVTDYANEHDIVQQAQARITRTASNRDESGIAARRVWDGPGVDLEGAPS
ncbi:MAG: hypothetical protein O7C67_05190, partial [Gammaproteobacteria bacterium]|nr:hypothetical protein [Gammaproteobacteria bacterium]